MRIRNKVLFLLPFLFLVSCDKIELSEDVTRLIYSPTLEDAKAKVKTVSASNINTIYDENNVEIGKETYTLSIDRTEFKEGYSYKRTDTYSGTRVVMDTSYSTSLMVSEKNTSVSYNADTSCYEVTVLLKATLQAMKQRQKKKSMPASSSISRDSLNQRSTTKSSIPAMSLPVIQADIIWLTSSRPS